jgi:hypothetical protein
MFLDLKWLEVVVVFVISLQIPKVQIIMKTSQLSYINVVAALVVLEFWMTIV